MRFLSNHHWNYSLQFFNTGNYRKRHPKELPHLSGIEEYTVMNYLLNQGWAFSVQLDLYEGYPDMYIVEGFDKEKDVLVWIKHIRYKKTYLSSLESKSLLHLAEENDLYRGFMLIKTRRIKLITWITRGKYDCYRVLLSHLVMF